MPELIAQGPQPAHRWRKKLPTNSPVILGRTAPEWSVPWDDQISRRHVELTWTGAILRVSLVADARNAVFFTGQPCDSCTVRLGQHFVLGSTTFTLADQAQTVSFHSPKPIAEVTFSLEELHRASYRNAADRIEVISRLPEILGVDISDAELFSRLVGLLLSGVSRASQVAVVEWRAGEVEPATILHWDHRRGAAARLVPSERLIRNTMQANLSTVHIWPRDSSDETSFTQSESVVWAYCTPLECRAGGGWCLYVAGDWRDATSTTPVDAESLQDDVKFTELVADTTRRLRELRQLERRQATLAQFISPALLDHIGHGDPELALAPREAEVSVLFCDLRGFSRAAEQAGVNLFGLLERVSRALGVMTRQILDHGGVIGDFHGDAAMGFWGWGWPLEQPDRVERACRAALAISAEFADAAARPGDPLADFRIGIGIASGRAVAGKIGTTDQVKITVFGPVVNLASRLQDLTKALRAPILLDEPTAQALRNASPAVGHVRRVARVRPRGFGSAVDVSELLPLDSPLSAEQLACYEAALDALQRGDWESAFAHLNQVSAADRVKDFLTVFIAQHHRLPPPNWTGIIDLP